MDKGGYQPNSGVVDPQNPPRGKVMVDPDTAFKAVSAIQDSGERRMFDSGAVRDISTGKGRFDLLPPEAIFAFAKHMENGAVKYEERNWEKGILLHSYWDSAVRHLFKYLMGMKDEDHLVAAFWNIGCLIATRERINTGKLPENLDDLPYGR